MPHGHHTTRSIDTNQLRLALIPVATTVSGAFAIWPRVRLLPVGIPGSGIDPNEATLGVESHRDRS